MTTKATATCYIYMHHEYCKAHSCRTSTPSPWHSVNDPMHSCYPTYAWWEDTYVVTSKFHHKHCIDTDSVYKIMCLMIILITVLYAISLVCDMLSNHSLNITTNNLWRTHTKIHSNTLILKVKHNGKRICCERKHGIKCFIFSTINNVMFLEANIVCINEIFITIVSISKARRLIILLNNTSRIFK
jgi:hypothetical protein